MVERSSVFDDVRGGYMNKTVLFPIVMIAIFALGTDADAFQTRGKIDMEFSYQSLNLRPHSTGCELTGRIRNDTKRTRNGLKITAIAYDENGDRIGDHEFRIPTIPAGNTNFFRTRIPGGCTEGPWPDRIEFTVEY
jgi:hypothetical protein